jgi:hypothetical protein
MAIEAYIYDPTKSPRELCEWITARGGRAAVAGVTMTGMMGVVFDTGFDTAAKLLVPGDQLQYNTVSKKLTLTVHIDLGVLGVKL